MSFTWSYYAGREHKDDVYVVQERHDTGNDVLFGDTTLMSETKAGLVKELRQAADDIEAQIKVEGEEE
jgi:hypothetical protein